MHNIRGGYPWDGGVSGFSGKKDILDIIAAIAWGIDHFRGQIAGDDGPVDLLWGKPEFYSSAGGSAVPVLQSEEPETH